MMGLFFALLVLSLTSVSNAFAHEDSNYQRVIDTGVLRCGYYIWPPFYDLDPNTGELTGLNRDLVDATANLLGLKVEYVKEITLGQQAEEFRRGEIDAICGDGAWVISASKFVDFTRPLFYAPVYAYGRTDYDLNTDLNNPDVAFIGLDGDLSQELAQVRFPKAQFRSYPAMTSPAEMMMNIVTKKGDVMILDPVSVTNFNTANPNALKAMSDEPLAVYWGAFSVRKGDVDLINMLNVGIDSAVNLGIYKPIFDRYDENGTTLFAPKTQFSAP